jgi:hypothetical protein
VIKNGGRLLYSDTDSIFAAFQRDVQNEIHGEVEWAASKHSAAIIDAVFIAPKTYAYTTETGTIIKIKGASTQNVTFNEIKNAFYDNQPFVRIPDLLTVYKHNFILTSDLKSKNFALNFYDKRKFINNKKSTEPFFFENFQYL